MSRHNYGGVFSLSWSATGTNVLSDVDVLGSYVQWENTTHANSWVSGQFSFSFLTSRPSLLVPSPEMYKYAYFRSYAHAGLTLISSYVRWGFSSFPQPYPCLSNGAISYFLVKWIFSVSFVPLQILLTVEHCSELYNVFLLSVSLEIKIDALIFCCFCFCFSFTRLSLYY